MRPTISHSSARTSLNQGDLYPASVTIMGRQWAGNRACKVFKNALLLIPRPILVTVAALPSSRLFTQAITACCRILCILKLTIDMTLFTIDRAFMAFNLHLFLAKDLITKRHACTLLFYLIDLNMLFLGIPQDLTPFIMSPPLLFMWF